MGDFLQNPPIGRLASPRCRRAPDSRVRGDEGATVSLKYQAGTEGECISGAWCKRGHTPLLRRICSHALRRRHAPTHQMVLHGGLPAGSVDQPALMAQPAMRQSTQTSCPGGLALTRFPAPEGEGSPCELLLGPELLLAYSALGCHGRQAASPVSKVPRVGYCRTAGQHMAARGTCFVIETPSAQKERWHT